MFYGYRFRTWIYVLPWDTLCLSKDVGSPSVSWVHFTEISGRCRAASTVGLSLWLEAFGSLHKENAPICVACCLFFFFFLWRTIMQNFFHTEVRTPLLSAWHGPSFPCSLSFSSGNEFFYSVLGVAAFILYFSWQWGKEKMRREYFACLGSGIQLVAHWGGKKSWSLCIKKGK